MAILIKDHIMNQICEELAKSRESVMIVSAYCKLPLIRQFDTYIQEGSIDKVLLVRFRPDDITSGASDLELYPYCKSHGWKMFFRLDLHAKTYIFDTVRCIIGSANATQSGMTIGGQGNYEMATACVLAEEDVRSLKLLLKGSVEIDDHIFSLMEKEISDASHSADNKKWPSEITDLFKPDYSLLFAEDFPPCQSPLIASDDDLMFLNIKRQERLSAYKEALEKSKCYEWLYELVKQQPNHEMYFGAITAGLHNHILNEPKPYRKDIKALLSNLLSWISILQCTQIVVDRPNHSQRVSLRE